MLKSGFRSTVQKNQFDPWLKSASWTHLSLNYSNELIWQRFDHYIRNATKTEESFPSFSVDRLRHSCIIRLDKQLCNVSKSFLPKICKILAESRYCSVFRVLTSFAQINEVSNTENENFIIFLKCQHLTQTCTQHNIHLIYRCKPRNPFLYCQDRKSQLAKRRKAQMGI